MACGDHLKKVLCRIHVSFYFCDHIPPIDQIAELKQCPTFLAGSSLKQHFPEHLK